MIEAELKARLADPDSVRAALAKRATPERATYRDTYFDTPAAELDHAGRELRIRTVETPGLVRHLLTFKEPAVDASGSKPEYESTVGDRAVLDHLIRALGLRTLVELTKECENYRFVAGGHEVVATLVRVPELEGTFLERPGVDRPPKKDRREVHCAPPSPSGEGGHAESVAASPAPSPPRRWRGGREAMGEPQHQARRPEWTCEDCGRPRPCGQARDRLRAETGDDTALAVLMWNYLERFFHDVLGDSAGAFERFIGWTRPGGGGR